MSETIRLGMVRLTDAAPVVYAAATRLFEAQGVDVRLAVEPSWANVADKLAWGLLDGAVMLPPLAIAMTLGLRDPPSKLVIAAGISRNGNAITLATKLADALLQEKPAAPATIAGRLRSHGKVRIAVVHAFSTHDLLLRLFLENGGIDPAAMAPFPVVPPAEMPQALAEGRIDGFCAGAPWGGVAAQAGVGRTVAVSSQIAADHPEKCLAMRAEWAEANPAKLRALVRALERAAAHCDDPANAPALAKLLARPEWVGVSARLIASSLPGGSGDEVDRSRFSVRTDAADALWLTREFGRWRTLPASAASTIAEMYWHELPAATAS